MLLLVLLSASLHEVSVRGHLAPWLIRVAFAHGEVGGGSLRAGGEAASRQGDRAEQSHRRVGRGRASGRSHLSLAGAFPPEHAPMAAGPTSAVAPLSPAPSHLP